MPARTRACSACRKKRIRCDGTLPHCLMCSQTGKVCPGPLQGPLIVDMTANARFGMKRRRSSPKVILPVVQNTHTYRIARDPVQDVVTKAFYANFLTHFTVQGEARDIQNKLTWLQRLPELAADRSNDALILALQATATAYGAIMSSHAALDKRARELYGTALRAHHGLLQRSKSKDMISIHVVSTSVLLSFFEAVQATTADAYRAHIYGAAESIRLAGPGQCVYGVLCQLFYHVRTQMLFIQLASDEHETPISAKAILYDTLLYKHPPLIQRLMCCIAELTDLNMTTTRAIDRHEAVLSLLRLQVDQLWTEFRQERGTHSNQNAVAAELYSFGDAFVALTRAFFSAVYILLAVHDPYVTDFTDSDNHFQLILEAATYLDTDRHAIAFMRMATPLLLVALHAKCHEHRQGAVAKFEIWLGRGMRGISTLALDAVRRHAGKDIEHAGLRQTPLPLQAQIISRNRRTGKQ